ncbi:hypothetical protein GUITHDRAFT_154008 [Guillardia theta CCMP2712]|uniref:Uncharacterized protein n=1 Tax=Guillardia theta (strain CCMP2712) TaxID=905079 RepID=L1IX30_GUITC|nr:hypothetical protein GUITHDRAFT_154008 [Guillardia theta CCMP2712]EKX40808.1 hypothetical protein GUITHDRAFT_154008 [Guillardia theta CCMP2712]|eukprot:XP_005827788.1 hypothetical protein GUITHDRAFT_154008 [Guillardia theta CCMP2712]
MLKKMVMMSAIAVSAAFAPGSVLPKSDVRLRSAGPVCLLAPGQMATPVLQTAETLTTMDGRGDKRTTKGKRSAKSFGKSRPRKGHGRAGTRLATGGVWGQPTC